MDSRSFKSSGKRQKTNYNGYGNGSESYGGYKQHGYGSDDRGYKSSYNQDQSYGGGQGHYQQKRHGGQPPKYGRDQGRDQARNPESRDQYDHKPYGGYGKDNRGYKDQRQDQRDTRDQRDGGSFKKAPQGNFSQRPQTGQRPQQNKNGYKSQGSFGSKPASNSMAVVPSKVNLVSNQYILKLGPSAQVHQYALEITGMAFQDTARVQDIIRFKRKAIERALGPFVCSGNNIYTLQELTETLKFPVTYKGTQLHILIDVDTGCDVVLGTSFDNENHSLTQNLINIIIKSAFRETSLQQIGRSPHFFDVKNPINLPRQGLKIWSGFKASAFQSELGCTLAIDNIFKFMSTTSCLAKLKELQQKARNDHQWQQICKLEFCNKSVIADWGNQRTYFVHDIIFDENPVTMKFHYNGQQISVKDYFESNYGKRISDPKQPLFLIKVADQYHHLPTEFCLIDGVPDSIRKSAGMRDALKETRMNPSEKIAKVQEMCSQILKQKPLKDWDLQIEQVPVTLSSSVLSAPQMVKNNQIINCDERELRNLPIQKSVPLLEHKWIMIYQHAPGGRQRSHFSIADNIFNTLSKASDRLNIKVEEPHWIEMEREDNREELEYKLREYMMGEKIFKHPTICLVVLGYENNYSMYKEVFGKYHMPSQVVTVRNGSRFDLSKASNILRQLNSKIGGDLFQLKFPASLDKKRTMLIGIDVCHAGPQSIVGFSASTNKDLSQYYSDYLIQKKGQEIVENKMKQSIKSAIEVFAQNNGNEFPTNFVIYRDGVGDAQREQVLNSEIPQFEQAIKELYNAAQTKPEITVVVVNKRIIQRFFVQDGNGRMSNPPSGCIIDKGLVESAGGGNNKKFDFFLTPANTTQGCVKPTHFFVPKNDSDLSRLDIQHLTFALCHFYFNWAGPIKVPAPCQYAHKIAEFYMTIGANRKRAQKDATPCQQEVATRLQVQKLIQPLNEKLHFL